MSDATADGVDDRSGGTWVMIALLAAGVMGVSAARWTRPVDLGPAASAARGDAQPERGLKRFQIDLNRATAAELSLLPGVGETIALRIVEHRETFGDFHSVESLDDVKGIGPGIIERISGLAVVDEAP